MASEVNGGCSPQTAGQPGAVVYQGYPSQGYVPQAYPPQGYHPQFQGHSSPQMYPPQPMYQAAPLPRNKLFCFRISIVLVNLLIAANCIVIRELLLRPWFRDGSTGYLAVMALHVVCWLGSLTNAIAVSFKAHRVLKYTQYTLSIFGLFYIGLWIVFVSDYDEFSLQSIAFFVGFGLIGFGGNYMTRKYLQKVKSNAAYGKPPAQIACGIAHVPLTTIQIQPSVQPPQV
jgi:hypothetical protein